jgi:hypothetical protein
MNCGIFSALDNLPPEILTQIVSYLQPKDLIQVNQFLLP